MAKRAEQVRPRAEREASADVELAALNNRQAMHVLDYAPRPHDPPRRLTPFGIAIVGGLALAALAFAFAYALAERFGGSL